MSYGYYGCLSLADLGADVYNECDAVVALLERRYDDMIEALRFAPEDLDEVIKEILRDPKEHAAATALLVKEFPEAARCLAH